MAVIPDISIVGRFTRMTNEQLYAILEDEANLLVEKIKLSIPATGIRDTQNRLANCIKYEKIDNLTIRVFADENAAPYFSYLEHGTQPHDIYPKNKQALKFSINGKNVFAKRIRHPGTRAYQPFNLSVIENKNNIIRRVKTLSELNPEK